MTKVLKIIYFGLRGVGGEVVGFLLSMLLIVCLVVVAIGGIWFALVGAFWFAVMAGDASILTSDALGIASIAKYGPWGASLDASIIITTIGCAVYDKGVKEVRFRQSLRDFNESDKPQ